MASININQKQHNDMVDISQNMNNMNINSSNNNYQHQTIDISNNRCNNSVSIGGGIVKNHGNGIAMNHNSNNNNNHSTLEDSAIEEDRVENIPKEIELNHHKLHDKWVFWYMNGDQKSHLHAQMAQLNNHNWGKGLIKVCSFDTIEGFWSIVNHMQVPSKLRVKNDYMLFREGIKPQWEDEQNKTGGSWKLISPAKFRSELLDQLWTETLFSLIGEQYGELGDIITGCYLQRRQKEDRIAIWTRVSDKKDEDKIMEIGTKFKETIRVDNDINFSPHEDSGSADHSNNKNYGHGHANKHSSWKHRNNNIKFTV
jgi:hypothetical protein